MVDATREPLHCGDITQPIQLQRSTNYTGSKYTDSSIIDSLQRPISTRTRTARVGTHWFYPSRPQPVGTIDEIRLCNDQSDALSIFFPAQQAYRIARNIHSFTTDTQYRLIVWVAVSFGIERSGNVMSINPRRRHGRRDISRWKVFDLRE